MTTIGNRLYQPENKKTTPERITLTKAESFAVLVVKICIYVCMIIFLEVTHAARVAILTNKKLTKKS